MFGEEHATQIAPVESPQMVSTVKLPILKKGEYTLWSIRMEQYLTNTDYSLWQVILNGDGPIQVTTDENGIETEVPPKTAHALLQIQIERKAKSILLLAIPDEYQLRFHGIKDAKSLWAAIKSRFGGNVESKKMQKNVLKQQFENFSVSDTEGLDKAYDRFQKLISLLEVHALIMRNKDGIDDLDIDDLYNNLKVFEADIKGSSGSSSNSQNVAFLSTEDTSSSNESNNPQLDDEDLEQIDHDDLEEMDLKWQGTGVTAVKTSAGNPQQALKNKVIFDSGCSRHMIGNKDFLTDYQDIDGGFVAFGGSARDGSIFPGKSTRASSTNSFNTVSTPVNTAGGSRIFGDVGSSFVPLSKFTNLPHDPLMPDLEDTAKVQSTGIFGSAFDDEDLDTYNSPFVDQVMGAEADFNNVEPSTVVSPIPTTRVYSINPKDQIIGDPKSAVQTRGMTKKSSGEHAMISYIQKQRRSNHKDFQNCLFACFHSQQEPIKIAQALDDEGWVEAMQEELLQFKIQKVWTLVDLPYGKKVIGTKWVYRNKKDERGIVVRNKARLVAQGYKQEEGIDYDEMDVKSAFLYGTIEEEVYSYGMRTLSTILLDKWIRARTKIDKTLFIKRVKNDILLVQVYVDDIIFGSTKKSLCIDFEQIMHKRVPRLSLWEATVILGLQFKQKEDGIFISKDKYVGEILKKFGFSSIRTASTPMETNKALTKDEDGEDVDVHLYRSMIRSLMYLTSSRPDIMFSVYACFRFQVQPKVSDLNAVKRIFRYLKGRPNLGLWYPKDFPFILEAFLDSDYAGASLDRKSTTGGCQFLGSRLISWQCKKQTVVANSTTKAEYIAASHYCGQVLWIQNHMLDYGYNFMQTKIHVDIESAICVVKNPIYNSKTKHIEIRHHFIRDSYENRLIEMVKIHTNNSVADLLTKAFDIEVRMDYIWWQSQVPSHHGGAPSQTRSERVLEQPIEPPLSECYTSGSGEVKMEHQYELMANVPIIPCDLPLPGGYTPGSDKGRLKLHELMTMCTKLSKQVLDLKKKKDPQAVEILKLKKRVKGLERQRKSSTSQPRRRKYRQVESSDDDLNEEDASKQGRSIHTLFMDGTPMEINMLHIEKKYPLIKELLDKMLNLQLEAEEESTMAFELTKFINSMLEE
ncbi:putative ribonuclease H-like domain-containing protein [Tanacetum coccineum]